MSGYADSLTSQSPASERDGLQEFAPDRWSDQSSFRQQEKGIYE
jgi:hypothetical protein